MEQSATRWLTGLREWILQGIGDAAVCHACNVKNGETWKHKVSESVSGGKFLLLLRCIPESFSKMMREPYLPRVFAFSTILFFHAAAQKGYDAG